MSRKGTPITLNLMLLNMTEDDGWERSLTGEMPQIEGAPSSRQQPVVHTPTHPYLTVTGKMITDQAALWGLTSLCSQGLLHLSDKTAGYLSSLCFLHSNLIVLTGRAAVDSLVPLWALGRVTPQSKSKVWEAPACLSPFCVELRSCPQSSQGCSVS